MSVGKVWIGHKLSRRMPLVNWQRLQEIGSYLSTLCDFCFRFGFRFCLRFSFRFWIRSYATCKLTAAICFTVQNQQLIAAVRCAPYFLLLYSLYCISNFLASVWRQHMLESDWSETSNITCMNPFEQSQFCSHLSQKHFQLCLLSLRKNDGNTVARSILLVSKRKQGPLKTKNKGYLLLGHFLIQVNLSELQHYCRDLCTHFA